MAKDFSPAPPRQASPCAAAASPGLPTRYEVLDYAGAGGFGTVWQVRDTWHDRVCAAKLLTHHSDKDWRNPFFREYALLYRLRHPGLVRAYDFGLTAADVPYFTMDWKGGPTLASETFSDEERLRIAWELVDTLTFLHRQDLIHADIKPDNIHIDSKILKRPLQASGDRSLTLLDFGLTLEGEANEDRARRGTVHYMAPEWFKSDPVDHRIDLYSLGVLLFELYAGRTPFDGDEPLRIVQQHLESSPPELRALAPDAPTAVTESIARLLSKQPEIRDKGMGILSDFVADHFGMAPGEGLATLKHHSESLGFLPCVAPAKLVDTWLIRDSSLKILALRGGLGLEQEQVLQSLVPDISRYGFTPRFITEPGDPCLHENRDQTHQWTALIAVKSDTAAGFVHYLREWQTGHIGPDHIALSIDADTNSQHELVGMLAKLEAERLCLMLQVPVLRTDDALWRVERVLGTSTERGLKERMVSAACGNPARLHALMADHIGSRITGVHDDLARTEWNIQLKREQDNIVKSFAAAERAGMTLISIAREPVSRTVLKSLADIPWSEAISHWLDLGFVESRQDSFEWVRPDLADALNLSLTESRTKVIHRSWAEYWSTHAPVPGTDAHEHMTFHLLRSDASRKAVLSGLEAARHWTSEHQAARALDTLDDVNRVLECVDHPAPEMLFDIAMANAEARRVLARYGEALSGLQEAITRTGIAGSTQWEAEIYKKMGDLCKSLKQAEQGKLYLNEALTRYRSQGNRIEESHVLNNLGNIFFVAGQIDNALGAYEEALKIQRELGIERDIASTLNNIGGLQIMRSRYHEAMQKLTEAVTIKRTLDDPEELARSLNNLSVVYVETGQYGRASGVLRESYHINLAAGKTGEQLFNLENLAAVAMARGEWSMAVDHCEAGMKLCDIADSAESRIPYLLVISGVALAQGNYNIIPNTVAEADHILTRIDDPDLTMQRQLFVAEWSIWLNHPDEVETLARAALDSAINERLPTWASRAMILRARGALLVPDSDPAQPREWLEKSLDSAIETGALPEQIRARIMLAEMLIRDNDPDTAALHLKKCESLLLESSAKPLFVSFSSTLGKYYQVQGDFEMALSVFDTARKLATNLSLPEWTWKLLASSGHILVGLRRYDDAVNHYRRGLQVLSHLANRVDPADQIRYMEESSKQALESGLRSCHQALVGN